MLFIRIRKRNKQSVCDLDVTTAFVTNDKVINNFIVTLKHTLGMLYVVTNISGNDASVNPRRILLGEKPGEKNDFHRPHLSVFS